MPHPYPALSPLDFERLCADLLGAEFGTRFETFAAGRDGGIDLRCHTDDGLVIGQAKHYQDRAALIRAMRTEKDKLAQIEPARYLLVTSCALTPANKDTLLEILAPYCRSSADIYGRDELDAALARHPAVLRRHFKLWLQDATQLSSILHNRLHQLSRARQAELADDLQTFVVPPMAATLLDRLARQHICVITGDAGVGKTTLCGYLALQLAAHDGYEVHVLRDTAAVGQAWDLLQPGQKQCFVLDDVFGATFLDTRQALALEHDLLSLLKQARRGDGRLKLMIASRGYVLQQGTARLPKLAQWLQAELHIDTIDHTRTPLRFKAEVLVNLLHYCGLGAAHKRAIADPRGYGRIISHAHFNPRLLKRLLDDGRQLPAADFSAWLHAQLDDPAHYWEQTFDRLSPEAQCLLYTLGLSVAAMAACDIKVLYAALYRQMHGSLPPPSALELAQKELEPAMVRAHPADAHEWLQFANPSIADLTHRMLQRHPGLIDAAIDSLQFYDHARHLLSLSTAPGRAPMLTAPQIDRLLPRLEALIGSACLQLQRGTEKAWRADEGQQAADCWQVLRALDSADDLTRPGPLAERMIHRAHAANWPAWFRAGRYDDLLDLACTALSGDTMTDALNAAADALQNSEDAAALARLLRSHPTAAKHLAPRRRALKKAIQKVCMDEVLRAQDEHHLSAILEDIEFMADALGADLDAAKYRAWEALEQWAHEFEGDEEMEGVSGEGDTRWFGHLGDVRGEWAYVEGLVAGYTAPESFNGLSSRTDYYAAPFHDPTRFAPAACERPDV